MRSIKNRKDRFSMRCMIYHQITQDIGAVDTQQRTDRELSEFLSFCKCHNQTSPRDEKTSPTERRTMACETDKSVYKAT